MSATFFDNQVVQVVVVIIIAYIGHHATGWIITWLLRRSRPQKNEPAVDHRKRQDTVRNVFAAVLRAIIWLLAGLVILRIFHFDVASVATGAGFLGIVVGIGAQATIRDYVSGFFILVENQYRVGDVVGLSGGTTGIGAIGTVEDVSLRITKLRDLDGRLHVVRNGEASIITNLTFNYSSVVIELGVTYDSDIDLVEKTINQVGHDIAQTEKFGKETIEPITFLRVDSFTDSGVRVKMVGKVTPASQWEVAGEYRRRLLKAFKKAGIEISLPQIVVHNKKHTDS